MTNAEGSNEKAAAVAQHGADVAQVKASSKKGPNRSNKTPKPPTSAKRAKARTTRQRAEKQAEPKAARETSKKAQVLDMMRRKQGATLSEIVDATQWQKHTIRGFVAGTLKKAGIVVESLRNDAGERTYKVAK